LRRGIALVISLYDLARGLQRDLWDALSSDDEDLANQVDVYIKSGDGMVFVGKYKYFDFSCEYGLIELSHCHRLLLASCQVSQPLSSLHPSIKVVIHFNMSSSKVLLILGAGPRIGKSIADFFSSKGYKVAVAGRTLSSFESSSTLLVKADFTDPSSIKGVFEKVKEKLGVPGVVVYNGSFLRPLFFC
jgi:hypothetical protein